MVRFFLAVLMIIITQVSSAETLHGFGDEHFYPTVERATGIRASRIWMAGLTMGALSYNSTYDTPYKNENDFILGEKLGSGATSLGLISLQFIFDQEKYKAQSHLRGLAYTVAFVFVSKAVLAGQWPGANYDYQPFPSAHTAIAFLSATSLTYAYGWKAAVLAYPAAAFVAQSRLGYDSNRASDVVIGAMIGVWMGRSSFYENSDRAKDLRLQKNPDLKSYEWVPIINTSQVGASFHYLF
jgi:hypothetical protein